mmetsp:Transcript_19116/g.45007  ORF Transcript_19116/g.45007 Transcript_19116/m.45007 type:complete len:282 (+) Transcript_19116:51-896(+)
MSFQRAYGDQKRLPLKPVALACTAGTAAALAVVLLLRRRRCCTKEASPSSMDATERELLLEVLAELSRRFFHICQDVASVAKTVRAKIEASNVAITDEKLREQLQRQYRVFERLEGIQSEVAQKFGMTPEAVQTMQKRAVKDPNVRAYAEGFKTMLSDALGGDAPVLPMVSIPEALTGDKLLEVYAEVHRTEIKKVLDAVGGTKCTVKKLGEVLSAAHKDAWDQVLESHVQLVQGGPEVFHSALAIHMRNEEFAAERKRLDEAHQKKMVKLFQAEGESEAK